MSENNSTQPVSRYNTRSLHRANPPNSEKKKKISPVMIAVKKRKRKADGALTSARIPWEKSGKMLLMGTKRANKAKVGNESALMVFDVMRILFTGVPGAFFKTEWKGNPWLYYLFDSDKTREWVKAEWKRRRVEEKQQMEYEDREMSIEMAADFRKLCFNWGETHVIPGIYNTFLGNSAIDFFDSDVILQKMLWYFKKCNYFRGKVDKKWARQYFMKQFAMYGDLAASRVIGIEVDKSGLYQDAFNVKVVVKYHCGITPRSILFDLQGELIRISDDFEVELDRCKRTHYLLERDNSKANQLELRRSPNMIDQFDLSTWPSYAYVPDKRMNLPENLKFDQLFHYITGGPMSFVNHRCREHANCVPNVKLFNGKTTGKTKNGKPIRVLETFDGWSMAQVAWHLDVEIQHGEEITFCYSDEATEYFGCPDCEAGKPKHDPSLVNCLSWIEIGERNRREERQ